MVNINISIYVYATNDQYTIMKMKEVLQKLEISDEYTYTVEPYWKFSDMFEATATSPFRTFDLSNKSLKFFVKPPVILSAITALSPTLFNS